MSRLNSQQLTPIWPYLVNHASPQARDLLAWYPCALSDVSFFLDLSGNGNHGSHTTGLVIPATTPDAMPAVGTAAGAGAAIGWTVPGIASRPQLSYSWWWRWRSSSAGFTAGIGSIPGIFLYRYADNSIDAGISGDVGNNYGQYPILEPIGNWQHFALVADMTVTGRQTFLYQNGRLLAYTPVASNNNTNSGSNTTFNLFASFSQTMDAEVTDFRIYTRALDQADVLDLYDPQTRFDLYWMPWLDVGYKPAAGAQTVNPAFLDSTAQLFAPTVTPGAVTVSPAFLASAAQLFAPSLAPGAVTISPARIESGAVVYAPSIAFDQSVSPTFLASTAQLFAPTVEGFTPATIPAHRLFTVAAETRIFEVSAVGCKAEIPVAYPDPDSNLWWGVDWTARLATGVTVVSSIWVLPATGLVKVDEQLATPIAKVRLTVTGDVGTDHLVTNRVTLSTGEIDDASIRMIVTQR